MRWLKRVGLGLVRVSGRLLFFAPKATIGTGGYGLAFRGALAIVYLLGVLVAWLTRGVGLAMMIVAAVGLVQLLLLEQGSQPRWRKVLWEGGVAVVLAVPVGIIWARWPEGGNAAGDVMVLGVGLVLLGLLPLLRWLFRQVFGPHHPESRLPVATEAEDAQSRVRWHWVGGVTSASASVVALVDSASKRGVVTLRVSDPSSSDSGGVSQSAQPDEHGLVRFSLNGLDAETEYSLELKAQGEGVRLRRPMPASARSVGRVDAARIGLFRTFPREGTPKSVRVALASCASTGSRGMVFDAIAATEPDVFVIMGDLHYENITARKVEPFLDAFDRVHASPPQRRLYSRVPIAYVWDDHDYGDNDSDAGSRSRTQAWEAYRLAVPHYLGERAGAIYQDFSIGRVHVVLTDNRSERNEQAGNLLTTVQEDWLASRINDETWPVVIWCSSTPWIGSSGLDIWAGYDGQRRRIAEKIRRRSGNLILASGDAHMAAIDDGSNSAYAGPGSGFPVLNAASLDRRASEKGGPYSKGMFPGAGQFGVIEVKDDGTAPIVVTLSARLWTGEVIVSHTIKIAPNAT